MNNTLNELNVGEKGRVVCILPESKVRRRLMDMGIVKGVDITISGKAPMGDPIEINLRGYNLTLRKSEAKDISVEKI
ncbi:ferrous iron transport protein A [Clostridium tetanomorphum]|uniref:Ferrous iron transport protein A n=1 Tax=Clostridium tetanomorphum TaxID=1553 RepID=A0A923EC88_CLOTT|nr:ferrous iron transport protein A [Clostridium tetanomorphum]KAJ51831.1 ferrous iron transport protein A [Clostridium tetanomorphum DSM 665]MBC2397713.1 ferrous iron transport protein A [Clostridium tetanomorphum]MBP1865068.1 ferrous iron transport protein A [Clostridium tetanomorphum]NRS83334.1 ferrous iron transport protein A [Clostridium tetanomorphum]NRZ96534.1 ferrous iron transport protein A [Clostridium tetanomorphum]